MLNFELVAHRGYPRHYPENTLIGIEAAIGAGASYVEVDIQLSRDQVPVLYHDHDMQRLSGKPGAVHDYSMEQLADFRAMEAGRFAHKYQDVPITRLSELAELIAANPGVCFFIELKEQSLEEFGNAIVVERVFEALEAVLSRCIIISYSLSVLHHIRQFSRQAIGVVIDDWQQHNKPLIKQLLPEYLFFDIDSLPEQAVSFAQSKLAVFECTDPQQARHAAGLGVHLVETFAIAEMRQQLGLD